jgi:hypothetical protein
MNQLLVDLLRVRVQSAVAASRAIDSIAHQGLKGRIREIFLEDLLLPLWPSFVGVGTVKIIDSENGQSPECDVVIYDRDVMPPLLMGRREAIFPIESVLCCIEVKTTLNSTELSDATAKARKIKELKNRPGRYPEGRGYDTILRIAGDCLRPAPMRFLFAFGSDLTGERKTELQRYQEIDGHSDNDGVPFIISLCIVGRAFHGFGKICESQDGWHTRDADVNHGEVLMFLGGLLDTIPELRLKRGYPAWSNYVVQY